MIGSPAQLEARSVFGLEGSFLSLTRVCVRCVFVCASRVCLDGCLNVVDAYGCNRVGSFIVPWCLCVPPGVTKSLSDLPQVAALSEENQDLMQLLRGENHLTEVTLVFPPKAAFQCLDWWLGSSRGFLGQWKLPPITSKPPTLAEA